MEDIYVIFLLLSFFPALVHEALAELYSRLKTWFAMFVYSIHLKIIISWNRLTG